MRVCIALGALALLVVALHAAPSSEQAVVPEVDFMADEDAKPNGPVSAETQEVMRLQEQTKLFRAEEQIKMLMDTDLDKAVEIRKAHPDVAHNLQKTQAKMSMLGVETVYAADMAYCKYLNECDLDFKTDGQKAACDKKTKDYKLFHKTLEKGVQLSAASAALDENHKHAALLGLNKALNVKSDLKKLAATQKANKSHNKKRAKLLKSKKCKKALNKVYDQAEMWQTKFIATCTKMAQEADASWQKFRKAQREAEEKAWKAKLAKSEIHITPAERGAHAKSAKPKSVKTVAAKVVVDEKEEIPEAAQHDAPMVVADITQHLKAANQEKNQAAKGLKQVLKLAKDPAKAIRMAHQSIIASQTAAHKEQQAAAAEASGVANTPAASLYQSEVELFQDVLP